MMNKRTASFDEQKVLFICNLSACFYSYLSKTWLNVSEKEWCISVRITVLLVKVATILLDIANSRLPNRAA